jgi:hypothetical protein
MLRAARRMPLPADLMLLRAAINRLEVDFSHHAARFDHEMAPGL